MLRRAARVPRGVSDPRRSLLILTPPYLGWGRTCLTVVCIGDSIVRPAPDRHAAHAEQPRTLTLLHNVRALSAHTSGDARTQPHHAPLAAPHCGPAQRYIHLH